MNDVCAIITDQIDSSHAYVSTHVLEMFLESELEE